MQPQVFCYHDSFSPFIKKKVLHKVEKNNLPCCITIPFKAANFVFSSLILAMLTENIERCHTYHKLSRHLKGYLLLAYVKNACPLRTKRTSILLIYGTINLLSMNVLNESICTFFIS